MSHDEEKPKSEPVKPTTPSSQPGTPIRKAPVEPVKPSQKPGSSIPLGEQENSSGTIEELKGSAPFNSKKYKD